MKVFSNLVRYYRVNEKHQDMPFMLPAATLQGVSYVAQSVYFLPTACSLSRSWEPQESWQVRVGFCSLTVLLSQGLLPAWGGMPAGMSWHCGCCKLRAAVLNRDVSPLSTGPQALLGSLWSKNMLVSGSKPSDFLRLHRLRHLTHSGNRTGISENGVILKMLHCPYQWAWCSPVAWPDLAAWSPGLFCGTIWAEPGADPHTAPSLQVGTAGISFSVTRAHHTTAPQLMLWRSSRWVACLKLRLAVLFRFSWLTQL